LSDIISDPSSIEKRSFEIIDSFIRQRDYSRAEFEVVKRVVHATADTDFAGRMLFSAGAVDAGIEAIRRGCNVVTDVRMLQAGISSKRPGGPENTRCFISDADVAEKARKSGTTRAAAAMRKAGPFLEGAIAVVGNAPTALYELVDMILEGTARPALVIGVPVGFVGAAESKDYLAERLKDVPFITSRGVKGGSPVGAAAVNAIIKLSLNE